MIDKQTYLVAVAGENAFKSALPGALNAYFRQNGINASCVPFNIRPDYFEFFMKGLKSSQIGAVFLEDEFMQKSMRYLDDTEEFCRIAGFADVVFIEESRLTGAVSSVAALKSLIERRGVSRGKRVALWGSSPFGAAFMCALDKDFAANIVLFEDKIKKAAMMLAQIPGEYMQTPDDIQRLAKGMQIDLGEFSLLARIQPWEGEDVWPISVAMPSSLLAIDPFENESILKSWASEVGACFVGRDEFVKEQAGFVWTRMSKDKNESIG